MSQTVADVLLSRLRDWGVRQVFGFPGDGINGLLAAWGRADDDPQFVQARHEEMAAFEAVGFAQVSGGVGGGPGAGGPPPGPPPPPGPAAPLPPPPPGRPPRAAPPPARGR